PVRRRRKSKKTPPVRRRRKSKKTPPVRRRRKSKKTPPVRRRRKSKKTPPVRRRRKSKKTPPVRRRRKSKKTPSVGRVAFAFRRSDACQPPTERQTPNADRSIVGAGEIDVHVLAGVGPEHVVDLGGRDREHNRVVRHLGDGVEGHVDVG